MLPKTEDGALAASIGLPAQSAATNPWQILAVLSALMGFASISTDFYLPAMPIMATSLRASAGSVEFTIFGYLVGFSVGQLFWGAVSDKYGRRMPVRQRHFRFGAGRHVRRWLPLADGLGYRPDGSWKFDLHCSDPVIIQKVMQTSLRTYEPQT